MKKTISDLDAIETGLIALHQTMFQHRAWEDLQKRAGITMDRSSATLLKVVAYCEKKPCRMQDIAQKLGIEAPSVTRTVQELEAAGLIKRSPDNNDRRASNVSLTKKGDQQLAKLQKARHQRLAQALTEWPTHDRQQLGLLLQRFADELSRTY